jgi:ectoine hydroxylase-related dioxygenase (phytanoyl-CoA dioxygenase family)
MTTTPTAADITFSARDLASAAAIRDLAAGFAEHGVAVVEDAITSAQGSAMMDAIARHFAAKDTALATYRAGGSATRIFNCEVWTWNPLVEVTPPSPPFAAMLDHPLLNAATTACLGTGWLPSPGCLVMKSAPGGIGQSWHQDCPVVAETHLFNLNRLLYPRDITHADGAVVVVPGSHRRGTIPAGGGRDEAQEAMPGEIVLTPRAGTLVLIHGWTWHRVTGNHSGRDRTSINFRAYPHGCPADGPTRYGVYRNGTADHYTGMVLEERGTAAVG